MNVEGSRGQKFMIKGWTLWVVESSAWINNADFLSPSVSADDGISVNTLQTVISPTHEFSILKFSEWFAVSNPDETILKSFL